MPRRLSDPEWLAFQNDVNLTALDLPPWGAVIEWRGNYILAFVCPFKPLAIVGGELIEVATLDPRAMCQPGEVMLTDVSDQQQLFRNIPGTWDQSQERWVYHVPEQTIKRLVEVAKDTIQGTGLTIDWIADTVGSAAGSLTRPLLENLTFPLIVIALVYLFGLPKRG
jgi:hypothetical protein